MGVRRTPTPAALLLCGDWALWDQWLHDLFASPCSLSLQRTQTQAGTAVGCGGVSRMGRWIVSKHTLALLAPGADSAASYQGFACLGGLALCWERHSFLGPVRLGAWHVPGSVH